VSGTGSRRSEVLDVLFYNQNAGAELRFPAIFLYHQYHTGKRILSD
jgi:hypothetical protein